MMSEIVEANLANAQHQTDASISHFQRAVSLEDTLITTNRLIGWHPRVNRLAPRFWVRARPARPKEFSGKT
jgi:hypothetical protein